MAAPFQPTAGGYTVLQAMPGKCATKQWSWNPTLDQWLKRTYSAGMWFHPIEEVANSLDDLAASIVRIAADPRNLIIRGALKPEHRDAPKVRKLKNKKPGADPFFDEVPRCWVMIDIDKFLLRPSDDLVDDPESPIAHAIQELLPPAFHDVRCFFQLSASAMFVPGILKVHVFFWLTAPIADKMLKATMRQCAPRLDDYSVFQGVQPHFIANPIIQGAPDPLPRRFGWIDGIEDAVTLPALEPPKARTGDNTSFRTSHVVGSEVEDHLARFGDGPDLDGFHAPLLRSTLAYARRCCRYGERNDNAMKATLTATIKNAPRGPNRLSVDEYLSDHAQQSAIDGAFALLLTAETDHQTVKPHFTAATGNIKEGRKELENLIAAFLERTSAWHKAKAARKEPGPAEQAGIAGVIPLQKPLQNAPFRTGFLRHLNR
jgi:hypothetical protein